MAMASLQEQEMTVIENKNRTAEEAKAVAFAEDNRELDWKSKSFMASMCHRKCS